MKTTPTPPAAGAPMASQAIASTSARPKRRRTSEPRTGLYRPTGVTPEAFLAAWSRSERETLIEVLIASLDAEDGDTDLEPSLAGYSPGGDDREGDGADDEDDGIGGEDDDREDAVEPAASAVETARRRFRQHSIRNVEPIGGRQ